MSEREITTTFFMDEPAPSYKAKLYNKPRLSIWCNYEVLTPEITGKLSNKKHKDKRLFVSISNPYHQILKKILMC